MYNAINDPKLEINNIKIELLKERANEKELKKLFDDAGSINEKKFKSLCKKYNINYYKINIRLKEHLKNNCLKLIEFYNIKGPLKEKISIHPQK